ncbi:PREDICTED: 46 kDa FK506-binding nuclear protein-like isoform X2 [Vollenhovia emeryi]|nr:PREDICTED: 46 kDa FK506-binding nuclear protein-like isoform X2 [Vollenhovia emeryi]
MASFDSMLTYRLICTLDKKSVWQVPLNINIRQKTALTFTCKGAGIVHLLGYYLDDSPTEVDWEDLLTAQLIQVVAPIRSKTGVSLEEKNYAEYAIRSLQAMEITSWENGQWFVRDSKPPDASVVEKDLEQRQPRLKVHSKVVKQISKVIKSRENIQKAGALRNSEAESNVTNNTRTSCNNSQNGGQSNSSTMQEIRSRGQEQEEIPEKKRRKMNKKKSNETQKDQSCNSDDEKVSLCKCLKILDLEDGTGEVALPGKVAVIYYKAWVVCGNDWTEKLRKVDKCKTGEGIKFKIGERHLLPGVEEGIINMRVGGKRFLGVPSSMGYGARGCPPDIPPFANLVYEIELLSIE